MRIAEHEELPRVMHEIAQAMGGCTAALTLHPEDGSLPSVIHIADQNVLSQEFLETKILKGAISSDFSSNDNFAWLNDPALDDGWEALIVPVQRVLGHSGLRVTVFFKSLSAEQRADAEKIYLSRRPFAVGYFRLWQMDRIKRRRIEALEGALDLTAISVILLDQSGGVVFVNKAGKSLLVEGDGLRDRNHHLHAATLSDGSRLQVAIDHVLGLSEQQRVSLSAPMLTIRRANRTALIVSILPTVHAATEPGDVAATIFVVDPDADTEQLLEPICQLFKLSHVETRLACQLAAGATLSAAAISMRLKEQTARSYLKQIFIKTGTNRQSDLVRTILSSLVRTFQRERFDVMK